MIQILYIGLYNRMGVYLYPSNTETALKDAYIGIPNPESITLDKSSVNLTTVGQTEQLTATIEPTICNKSITWSSDDTTVATVSTSGLVTCVTPGTCTITATTVNGLTATCSVIQARTPGANTLVYLPLNGDALDKSGNNRNGTLPNNYSWGSLPDGGKCFSVSGGSMNFTSYCVTGSYANTALGSGDRTVSIRVKFNGTYSNQVTTAFIGRTSGGTQGEWFGVWHTNESATQLGILRYYNDPYTTSFSYDTNRHNYVITYNDTNKGKVYVDGTQIPMTTDASSSFNTIGTTYAVGLGRCSGSKSADFSKFIIENREWSAQDIADYYDQTKADYGIS